ncbi:MAG: hypothetical protein WB610_06435, partial [Rhodomicrobium sp.]
ASRSWRQRFDARSDASDRRGDQERKRVSRVWSKRQRIATPSSRKGEALSGIVTDRSACLYAIPARASLGRDDELARI